LGKSPSSRQSEIRRKLGESWGGWWPRIRALPGFPIAIALGFVAGAFAITLSGQERSPYYLGQTLTQPVLSRVRFERVNKLRTAEVRKQAQQDVPNYFRINQGLLDAVKSELDDLRAAVNAAESFAKFSSTDSKRWPLDQAAFDELRLLCTDEASRAKFKKECDAMVQRLATYNMVERADVSREIRSTASVVELDRGGGVFSAIPKERLTYANTSEHVERVADRLVPRDSPPAVRAILVGIIKKAIAPAPDQYRPVYVFDQEYTKKKIDEAGALEPVKDSYQVGDRLVQTGVIDGEALALLKAEHEEYLRQRQVDTFLKTQWAKETFGLFGLILLITGGLAVFTHRAHPRITERPLRALGLAILLLSMLLANRLVLVGMATSPIWSVTTITMTAAILTIAYSQYFALGATASLALLTVLTLGAPFGLFIVHLVVISVTALMLEDVRTRLKMVELGGITAFAAAISAQFVGLTMQEGLQIVAKQAAFAALAAFAGISVVLVLLPIIERAFRITTSLTLLEWADTSNPILRHLIEKSPGTWQHSHLLGSMAEAAAEEIGANGLLVRVGAYYHDIGKTSKPHYFIENQSGKTSAHQGLAPRMSLLVILAHVKDGLAMAREHGLPRVLHQFIAEHHGTTLVRFFHDRATREARASGREEREISESEFRYPGPKPRSRESAILMLCDGVEGAVRALQEPTPGRIEGIVHEIAMSRLMDGQFDDCDITLKELARVEQSIVKSLQAFHHGRIAYPRGPEEPVGSFVRSA
jgi:putative nucleotidyltransferase with HDIG domain